MTELNSRFDAIIIGGGFYGAAIAIYLAKKRNFSQILLIEKESALLTRASYNNQARIHNGYHYPRSFTTAYRSRINLPKFVRDWPDSISQDFTKLYAIARRNSKVTARQFERFCYDIGAEIWPAGSEYKSLFEARLIEEVFLVKEFAFDAVKLAAWAEYELRDCGVSVQYDSTVYSMRKGHDGCHIEVAFTASDGMQKVEACKYVFNCTYSGLNQISGDFPGTQTLLKQEVTEMALLKAPSELEKIGVTVMDGPFFSMMPFPARKLHTLSHVRYTPHFHWADEKGINPYEKLDLYVKQSRVDRMIRDAARYIPAVVKAIFQDSLFEVKTVLVKNESDDGRPILFEKHQELPGCYSILGGKIDNIYDVLEKLEMEELCAVQK
jgi:hypothetical protein